MDDLLNFETSFAEDGDSDNDLLASDDENQPLSTGAPSANIPTMAQHQKLPSDAHNSYSLYNDAQKRQEKLEKLRQKKFEDEFAKGNFQPNLTSSAKKRSKSVSTPNSSTTSAATTPNPTPKVTNATFHRMYSHSKTMNHRKEERAKQLQEEEAQNCTFKPKNFTSPSRRSSFSGEIGETIQTGSVFERQYEYSKVIEKKKEELAKSIQEKECTFKPDIEKTSPTKNGGPITTRRSSVEATVKRLYDPEKFKLAEKERLKRQKELELSEATFSPNVNRTNMTNITGGTTESVTTSSAPPSESGDGEETTLPHPGGPPPNKAKSTEACLRLYQKANIEGSKREKWIEEQKDKKVKERCTFSPNISGSARKAKRGSARGSITGSEKTVFERLQRNDFKVFHNERDENLTFKPKILEKKIKDGEGELAKLVAMPLDERFDRLYKEGKERIEKKNMLPKDEQAAINRRKEQEELRECTFKPKTTWKQVFGMGAFDDDDSYDYGHESSFMANGEGGFEFVDKKDDFDDEFDEEIGQGEDEDEVLGSVDQANVQAQEALGEVNDILGEITIDNESMGVQHDVEVLQVERQDSEHSDEGSEHNIWEDNQEGGGEEEEVEIEVEQEEDEEDEEDNHDHEIEIDIDHTEFDDTESDPTLVPQHVLPPAPKEIDPVSVEPPIPPATDEEVHDNPFL
ncbi:hypothetical protein TL16_g10832 [Triparma laevis f. inornata]|uniref:Uncharacterized protein n=1 Tax=Triparma laevis f. inornata TaxID=1714386 RepID=A0A9W7BG93_9STRA|nr:hypothetical protein TL16_g10832 [Triparma laevis f. inornata]